MSSWHCVVQYFTGVHSLFLPSVLWRCWLGGRKGIHPVKKWGDGGGGHWLVRMEWRPAGWSVCLLLLIFPCTIKSISSLLAPALPAGPGKRAVKRSWWWWWYIHCLHQCCVCVCLARFQSTAWCRYLWLQTAVTVTLDSLNTSRRLWRCLRLSEARWQTLSIVLTLASASLYIKCGKMPIRTSVMVAWPAQ